MEYLNSRLMFGMVPGLTSTRMLCEALGNPQKKFKTIHVVGTNGKGSCSYYLSGIFMAHGFKTALYTSPHLVNLRERIRIDDIPISEEDLDRYLLQVKDAAERVNASLPAGASPIEPTFFEVLTLVAFLHYANSHVEIAVLEAGMGGRLDSTAVAGGDVAIVTSIGLEHTEVLGPTESAILKEKMAVLGTGSLSGKTFIVGGLSKDLLIEARQFAKEHGTNIVVPEIRNDVVLPNLGQHYVENASLSLTAAKMYLGSSANSKNVAYDDALALRTLRTRSWAGRMQTLADKSGRVRYILDGAHNSHAVKRLVETLAKYYPNQKFHCVFGALKDKDVGEMLKLMAPYISHWHITKTPYPRFRELDNLKELLEGLGLNVASAAELSRKYLDEVLDAAHGETVLITGSLYMIGATIQALKDDYDGLAFFRGLEPTTNEHR